MKAVVFGANGQDGFYLNNLLHRKEIKTILVSRSASRNNIVGDISDYSFVRSLIKEVKPQYIFHLAANSTTNHNSLFENYKTISDGTNNLLEAVKEEYPKAKVFLSGSAMQFENRGMPIDEQTPFEATSPYAVARIQSVYAGRYYRNRFGLKVFVGYLFNHDSCLRSKNHVNQKIIKGIQDILSGRDEKIEIGDLDVYKEFNYAGDIVNAIWSLMEQDNVFEAVIGSGKAHSIREWIECCSTLTGRNLDEYFFSNPYFKPEYKILVSNPSLIKSLGWVPQLGIKELAALMLANKI